MKGFGRSHRRDVLLVKSLEGAEGYSFFRGKRTLEEGFTQRLEKQELTLGLGGESLVWTAVQPWETAITSLGLSFPCANHTEGLLGGVFLLKHLCIIWLL